jgi:hypothetical protein
MDESQKRACLKYQQRLKTKGIRQHAFWLTDTQFDILRAILKALKLIDLSQITSLDVDEQTKTIRLIEKNRENLPTESESTTKMMGDAEND